MYLKYLIFLLFIGYPVLLSGLPLKAEKLSRSEAIRLALKRNPEVIASRKQWDAARAQVLQARALPDPELGFEYEELPGVSRFGKFGERNIGITQKVEFPVKWWFRNRAVSMHAKAVKMTSFEKTNLEVATRVKIAFDRVLMGQKVLEYTEENLELARELLQKAKVRFDAGEVPELEVLRAEVETGRAENRLTVARNNLSVSYAELKVLLASDIRTTLEVAGELTCQPLGLDLERLRGLSMERHPVLLGVQYALSEARFNRSAVVSSIVPDLNVGIFRQSIRDQAGKEDCWRVGLGLNMPIWAMFRQRGEIAQASAETARAEADEHTLRYQVLLEVERAFLDLKAAENQVELFQKRILREAERAYEVASLSYREGKASYLELLEAQRTLTETRMEYAQALFNNRSALAALERAVGGNLPE